MINVYNNFKFIEIKDVIIGLVFFVIFYNGGDWKFVSFGFFVVRVVIVIGF